MLSLKRKHEEISDGSPILINMIMDLMFQYNEENYETDVMLKEITDLIYTSDYNIFDTKEDCLEYVQNVMLFSSSL
jgi:hypothetical protein